MAKKKSPEAKLAEAVAEMGIEKAQSFFDFLKALNAPKKTKAIKVKEDPEALNKAIRAGATQ